jgi:transcriptional antiterminator RfaH
MPLSSGDPEARPDSGPDTTKSWLAIWTKPRAEKVAARSLHSHGVPHWLPTMKVRRRWSDRWKEIEVPLFSSYLFAEVGSEGWASLLQIPGILTVVKTGRDPAWIRQEQMADLRHAIERLRLGEEIHEVVQVFELGEKVRVTEGPMAGLVGVIREIRGSRRLLVGIEQIGRALSISIGGASVERVGD